MNPKRLCYLVTGDLAFFYDINVLGNRHVGNNVRILLINNGVGTEFKMNSHNSYMAFKEDVNEYMAAEGHFGRKSPCLVKHFAEDLGFEYLTASTKTNSCKRWISLQILACLINLLYLRCSLMPN